MFSEQPPSSSLNTGRNDNTTTTTGTTNGLNSSTLETPITTFRDTYGSTTTCHTTTTTTTTQTPHSTIPPPPPPPPPPSSSTTTTTTTTMFAKMPATTSNMGSVTATAYNNNDYQYQNDDNDEDNDHEDEDEDEDDTIDPVKTSYMQQNAFFSNFVYGGTSAQQRHSTRRKTPPSLFSSSPSYSGSHNSNNNTNQKGIKTKWFTLSDHFRRGNFALLSEENYYHPSSPLPISTTNTTGLLSATTTNATKATQQPTLFSDTSTTPSNSIINASTRTTPSSTAIDHESRREAVQESIQSNMQFTIGQCIIAILLYLLIAIIAFSFVFEQWTIIDSMYFAVVTFTTIGYGDLAPDTVPGRLFTCFFALSGVASLGIALGIIGTNLMSSQSKAIVSAEQFSKFRAYSLFQTTSNTDTGTGTGTNSMTTPTTTTTTTNNSINKDSDNTNNNNNNNNNCTINQDDPLDNVVSTGSVYHQQEDSLLLNPISNNPEQGNDPKIPLQPNKTNRGTSSTSSTFKKSSSSTTGTGTTTNKLVEQRPYSGLIQIVIEFLIVLLILLLFASILVIIDPGIDIDDALYFTIVTASTVGYGDYAPQSQLGRGIAIIFIPIAVGSMGHWLSVVASYIMDLRKHEFQQRLHTHDLSLSDIEIMDVNQDGNVSFIEFLEFMLIAMNKVDKETIQELHDVFNRLDVDQTGTLSYNDLTNTMKYNIQDNTQRKKDITKFKKLVFRGMVQHNHHHHNNNHHGAMEGIQQTKKST